MPFELMMLLGFFGTALLTLLPARPDAVTGAKAGQPADGTQGKTVRKTEAVRRPGNSAPPWHAAA